MSETMEGQGASYIPSYVRGDVDTPLLGDTIGTAFDRAVQRYGASTALVVSHQQVAWSYAELASNVAAFAAGLFRLGLIRGDRIGIWAPNCVEWTITQYAAAKAGLILVNINPAYRKHELEFVLNAVACKALVTAAAFKSSDYLAMLCELAPELLRD